MGREMSPVLSPSVGGLGTIGNRTEVLGAVLGPGVGSPRWDCVGPGWDVEAGRGAVPRVGGTEVQTASMLALPGVATELQLGEEEVGSGDNRGQKGSAWLGSLMGSQEGGQGVPAARMREREFVPHPPSERPLSVPTAPPSPHAPHPVLTSGARLPYTCWLCWDPPTMGQSHPGSE